MERKSTAGAEINTGCGRKLCSLISYCVVYIYSQTDRLISGLLPLGGLFIDAASIRITWRKTINK